CSVTWINIIITPCFCTASTTPEIYTLSLHDALPIFQEMEGLEAIQGELQRLRPAELLVSDDFPYSELIAEIKGIRRQAPWHFEQETAERLLTQQFQTRDLSGFGCDGLTLAIQAAGCLLNYARETQRTALPHIRRLIRERREDSII